MNVVRGQEHSRTVSHDVTPAMSLDFCGMHSTECGFLVQGCGGFAIWRTDFDNAVCRGISKRKLEQVRSDFMRLRYGSTEQH